MMPSGALGCGLLVFEQWQSEWQIPENCHVPLSTWACLSKVAFMFCMRLWAALRNVNQPDGEKLGMSRNHPASTSVLNSLRCGALLLHCACWCKMTNFSHTASCTRQQI